MSEWASVERWEDLSREAQRDPFQTGFTKVRIMPRRGKDRIVFEWRKRMAA
jgi:hypothetical protein